MKRVLFYTTNSPKPNIIIGNVWENNVLGHNINPEIENQVNLQVCDFDLMLDFLFSFETYSRLSKRRMQQLVQKSLTARSPKLRPPLIITHSFMKASINQSEVEDSFDSFQLASDWIKSARNNVNKLKAVTLLGSLL